MLREREISQKRGDRFRRLFVDETFYLFVWYEPKDVIWGFQLIYRLPERPLLMVTWRPKGPTWNHDALSEGARADSLHGTGTDIRPIDDDLFEKSAVVERFRKAACSVEPAVREFVAAKLVTHPDTWKPCAFCKGAPRPAFQSCGYCGVHACERCAEGSVAGLPACTRPRHAFASRW